MLFQDLQNGKSSSLVVIQKEKDIYILVFLNNFMDPLCS